MNIDSLDQLLELIHESKEASILFGQGGLLDADHRLPAVTFEIDQTSFTFVRIEDKWWHRRDYPL